MSKPETAPRTRLNDARSLRSQALLREALLSLIERRQFEQITLREIAAEAGVSYPTVFNHYAGKDDLFQDIARTQIQELIAAFRTGLTEPDWRPGEGMCAHIMRHRSLWRTLLTTGASDAMRAEFVRRGRDLASDRPALTHGFPIDLVSGIVASGTFEVIAWWLSQDEDVPPATVANMLETLVVEPALGVAPGTFTNRRHTTPGG